MTEHSIEFDQDDGGWDIARCSCGWESPPSPDKEIAADFWGDHIAPGETPRAIAF